MKPEEAQNLNNLTISNLLGFMVDDLSEVLLNERIPLDVVNAKTGAIIIPANCKITKTLRREMARVYEHVDIDPSPIRTIVREIIGRFEERLANEQLKIARGQLPESLAHVELRQRAESGDVQAQYDIGCFYYTGTDIFGQDRRKAKLLFKAAAEKGHIKALTGLGVCYRDEKDFDNAKICYQEASAKGDSDAQYLLAGLSSKKEALCLYHAAAKQGNSRAMRKLGDCWALGRNAWWHEHGVQLIAYSFKGESASADDDDQATPVETLDRAEAAEWYRIAAEHNDAEAQRKLGDCYADGWIIPQDYKEGTEGYREKRAVKWYRKAAEQGDTEAQVSLAYCYEHGIGVAKSEVQAAKWYSRAGSQGDNYAYEALGDLYASIGEKRKATKAYRKAGFH